MRRTRTAFGIALTATTLALSTSSFALASTPSSSQHQSLYAHGRTVPAGYGTRAVCPQPASPVLARCLAIGITASPGSRRIVTTDLPVAGVTPADIQDAYNLPATGGKGRTVAVVEAGDYPHLASDLATYRDYFGLPACTEESGCLTIANQHGGSTLPHRRNGWSIETALDVDSVSAACPTCHILVIEAKNAHRGTWASATPRPPGWAPSPRATAGRSPSSRAWTRASSPSTSALLASRSPRAPATVDTLRQVTIGYPAGLPTVLSIGGNRADQGRQSPRLDRVGLVRRRQRLRRVRPQARLAEGQGLHDARPRPTSRLTPRPPAASPSTTRCRAARAAGACTAAPASPRR